MKRIILSILAVAAMVLAAASTAGATAYSGHCKMDMTHYYYYGGDTGQPYARVQAHIYCSISERVHDVYWLHDWTTGQNLGVVDEWPWIPAGQTVTRTSWPIAVIQGHSYSAQGQLTATA